MSNAAFNRSPSPSVAMAAKGLPISAICVAALPRGIAREDVRAANAAPLPLRAARRLAYVLGLRA